MVRVLEGLAGTASNCVKRIVGNGNNTLGVSRESLRAFIRGEVRLEDGTLV